MPAVTISGELTIEEISEAIKKHFPDRTVKVDKSNEANAQQAPSAGQSKEVLLSYSATADQLQYLKALLERKTKDMKDMEANSQKALQSIQTFQQQQKALLDEFIALHQKYDEQKLALVDILWGPSCVHDPALKNIPSIEPTGFVETAEQVRHSVCVDGPCGGGAVQDGRRHMGAGLGCLVCLPLAPRPVPPFPHRHRPESPTTAHRNSPPPDTAPRPPSPLLPPQVGNYLMGDELGSGQFAAVRHCCRVNDRNDIYAIKIIKKERITTYLSLTRLSDEVGLLKKLQNQYVIGIRDTIQTAKHFYIVTEKGGADMFEFFDEYDDGVPEPWAKVTLSIPI